jgi:fructose-1-phosphate kinase PfkB-like protein
MHMSGFMRKHISSMSQKKEVQQSIFKVQNKTKNCVKVKEFKEKQKTTRALFALIYCGDRHSHQGRNVCIFF